MLQQVICQSGPEDTQNQKQVAHVGLTYQEWMNVLAATIKEFNADIHQIPIGLHIIIVSGMQEEDNIEQAAQEYVIEGIHCQKRVTHVFMIYPIGHVAGARCQHSNVMDGIFGKTIMVTK